MSTQETVTVEFPDGPREIVPEYWVLEEDFLSRPNRQGFGRKTPYFKVPGFKIKETVDGKFIAVSAP